MSGKRNVSVCRGHELANALYSPFVRCINFCHLINLSSSYQTSVIFSLLVIYSLFTLSSHPINAFAAHTTHTQLSFRLIVRTLSAPIYLSNSPGAFGHRAILTMGGGDRTVAGGGGGSSLNKQICVRTSLPFLHLFPRQTQTTKFPRLPRRGGSHGQNFHLVNVLQRRCEYSNAIAFHGPKILLRTIHNSVYPTVLCDNAATPRVCFKSQRPNIEG